MELKTTLWSDLSETERSVLLQRPHLDNEAAVDTRVSDIIAEVRRNGDQAVQQFSREFDGADLHDLTVDADEMTWAANELSTAQHAAIELAVDNVSKFHKAQLTEPISVETMPGVLCERISQPINPVGLYVPAGSAPLPSTAIMLCVPAAIAGCETRIICTPPRSDGRADPAVVVAAMCAGTERIFKIGGAQAIAAMAYGTATVPRVNKVFGPGNTWVTAAKKRVAMTPGGPAIDMPAGPSEVLVIADDAANASFVASDLLSQAEHGEDSQVILLTNCKTLANNVIAALGRQLGQIGRQAIARAALANCRIVVTADLKTAVRISNSYAPEHLIVQTQNPREQLTAIRNAGSIFLGPWSPESAGDYCSGTNHVLPTYGHAASYSGLSVDQFMRQTTVQELSKDGLASIATAIDELALMEGLDAHANAVRIRFANTEI
ncbi:MAG: histidinol dehydrogenase [Woeseiaceae bacterium]|jgi:histidinol dehydrogenase